MITPFGFWSIQALNLSLCAIPKGGSTMNRQLVAKAAGALHKNECFLEWKQNNLLFKNGVTRDYSNKTTNIAIVRDPWTRAVSGFMDQIQRKYIPNNISHDAFMTYLEYSAQQHHLHHTGSAATMCIGHTGARFDHIINLEDISSFAKVARDVPAYGHLIEEGWEHCTHGDPRLYMPGSISTHANPDHHLKYRLCSPTAIQAVCRVYKDDYKVYSQLGHPFKCECQTLVQGSFRS